MRSLRIGLIDLDTSHPANWVPIIRKLGHEVVGVYDSGTVYPSGYSTHFIQDHNINRVYSELAEMADEVDLAIIHSCNWDTHIEKAKPFVRAGKALLIDKPFAGNVRDLFQLLEWEKQGVRIAGGSSLRWCKEVKSWNQQHSASDIIFAYAGCSVDEFNYGIHAYSLLHGIMGSGVHSVRYLGTRNQHQMEIIWKDGRRGQVGIGATAGYLPFYATVTTNRDVSHLQVDTSSLYESMLEAALPYLAGDTDSAIELQALLEVEFAAIAARLSRHEQGKTIYLDDLRSNDDGYDGQLFAAGYRLQKL